MLVRDSCLRWTRAALFWIILRTRAHRSPSSLLNHLLARPWLALLGLVPLLTIAWIGYRNVGSGFMPAMDEGGFVLDYFADPGTSLTETDRLLRQVEAILQSTPDVQT